MTRVLSWSQYGHFTDNLPLCLEAAICGINTAGYTNTRHIWGFGDFYPYILARQGGSITYRYRAGKRLWREKNLKTWYWCWQGVSIRLFVVLFVVADGEGAVKLFEQNNAGEFVGEGEGGTPGIPGENAII